MSLRLRLTLLYSSLLGGVIIILGVVVYGMVSAELTNQLDGLLTRTAYEILPSIHVNANGDLEVANLASLSPTEIVFVQLWDRNNHLLAASENIRRFNRSIDPDGLHFSHTVFRDSRINQALVRVVNIPLQVNQRPVGMLQIGVGMSMLEYTQKALLSVMFVAAIIATVLAAGLSWLVINRALAPLETMTQAAIQIVSADDLSRRIPVAGTFNDEIGQLLTAFNQTLSRLEQLFSAQRRFMADVSHELRTPLTVIKGNVGLMRRMGSVDEESLGGIETEVDRLTRLVGDLLLLAQAESGKIPLDMRPVDLDTVLLEVFQQMRVLSGERLQVRLTEIDQVQVIGDRDRLKQVLLNLGGNAIKYTPPGGKIQLGLYRTENQVRIVISDSGPGIPTEDLPHIFERFYRGEKSRTRAKDGSSFGLGLSIAYWIVRNHGGRIEVEFTRGSRHHLRRLAAIGQTGPPPIQ